LAANTQFGVKRTLPSPPPKEQSHDRPHLRNLQRAAQQHGRAHRALRHVLRQARWQYEVGADNDYGSKDMTDKAEAAEGLPPLPQALVSTRHGTPVYTVGQMLDYARAALKAQPAPTEAPTLEDFPVLMKDHNVRQLVNDLRDIAVQFHAAGQLRARISGAVGQFLDKHGLPKAPTEAQGEDSARLDAARAGLLKIIEMNRFTAEHKYGNAEKAESWSCVTVARDALNGIHPAIPAAPQPQEQS
jgi:hypothetical protein